MFQLGVTLSLIVHRATDRWNLSFDNGVVFGRLCAIDRPGGPLSLARVSSAKELENEVNSFRSRRDDYVESLKQIVEGYREELRQQGNAFTEIMKKSAVSDHWSGKADKHWWAALWYGVAAPVAAVAGAAGIILFSRVVAAEIDKLADHEFGSTWPHLLPLIVALLFVIWLVRVLVRMFLSNIHQQADAARRTALLKTWIAMEVGERKPTDAERLVLVNSICQNSGDGIFPDDAAPQIPIARLTDVKSPSGSH